MSTPYEHLTESSKSSSSEGSNGTRTKLPRRISFTRGLAIVTLLMIPFAICINIFWSYRLDPVGYYRCLSNYPYAMEIDCNDSSTVFQRTACRSYTTAYWTHKITTVLWTCLIILHVCLITAYGKLNFAVHELLGLGVILCANLAATSGLIMVQADLIRYDTFTNTFVITAAAVVYTLTLCWLLSYVFKPKFGIVNCHHSNFGFLFLFPPLAMLYQFVIYSIGIAVQGLSTGGCSDVPSNSDYSLWKISFLVCVFGGLASSVCFYINYFKITKPYLVKKNSHKDEMDGRCCCCKVTVARGALELFGNMKEQTPAHVFKHNVHAPHVL